MSGGSTKTTKQETSTSSNAIDPRQLAMLEDNYARAKANAGRLKPYDGTFTAGFTPAQIKTQEMLAGIAADGGGRTALSNASTAVQDMLRYRPAALPVASITAPLVAAQAPVANRDVTAARIAAQAPVQTGASDVALAAAQGPVTAERMTATSITPQSALAAPVIDAASAAREAPVDAERMAAGQLAGADLSAYANPFTDAVIDRTLAGNERARRIALAENARKASAANAFGGSRSAVLDAATGEAHDRNTLDALAGLNRENFTRAQDMALADIDRRFQSDQFNAGNRLAADTLNANLGQQVTLANQAALNSIRERNAANDIATGQWRSAGRRRRQLSHGVMAMAVNAPWGAMRPSIARRVAGDATRQLDSRATAKVAEKIGGILEGVEAHHVPLAGLIPLPGFNPRQEAQYRP